MYSGDGANANKCSSLINYINGDLINKKSVVEMGCGDMRVTQKLDFAQMVMVLALSKNGGNCIVKHFMPLNFDKFFPTVYPEML